ncbi:MAG: DedA family protein [Pseudomonadota bacterium]
MESPDLIDSLRALLQAHGYSFLALGLLIEGETVVLLAGFAAHQGHLRLPLVLLVVAGVTFAVDQALFWLGRWKGEAVLARQPRLAVPVLRAHSLIARYPRVSVLGLRFAYGLRVVGPIVIGASGLPAAQYALLSAAAIAAWATVYTTLGWFFGAAAERVLTQAGRAQLGLLALIVVALAVGWWWRRRRGA